jgi:hypothetical protein
MSSHYDTRRVLNVIQVVFADDLLSLSVRLCAGNPAKVVLPREGVREHGAQSSARSPNRLGSLAEASIRLL